MRRTLIALALLLFAALPARAQVQTPAPGGVVTFQAFQQFVNDINASFGPCGTINGVQTFMVATALGGQPTCESIPAATGMVTGTGTTGQVAAFSGASAIAGSSSLSAVAGKVTINNGAIFACQVGGGTNVTPSATFADGTHCGVGGSISATSDTCQMTVTMGTTAPTTACPIAFGTSAQCPNGSTCTATAQNPDVGVGAAGTATGVTLTSYANSLAGQVINVHCTCW